jgi:tripartite motif-containing protein 71
MNKSIKLSTLLIIILVTIIGAIIYFGLYYSRGLSPLPGNNKVATEPLRVVTAFDGGNDPLSRPLGVAAGPKGKSFVADTGNNRVMVFDSNGKVIKVFGHLGTKDGEFNFPSSIAVSNSGKVYVADFKNNRIQVFDVDGNIINIISSVNTVDQNAKPLMFSPVAVAIDSKERIYISDTFRQRILVLDQNGKLQRIIGQEGSQPGQLLYANGLAVDENNNLLLVSDSNNARIQAFDLDGKFLWKQESAGKDSVLALPKGIAIANGVIFVADAPAHRIVVYNKEGKFLYKFGIRSDDNNGFNFPTGLAWQKDLGSLLIADRGNNRIDLYK